MLRVVPEEGYGEGIFRIADIRTNSIGYASLRRYQSYTRAPADLVCLVARRARNLHSPEKFIRSLNTEGHRKHVNSFLRGFSIPSRESRRDTPESYLGTFDLSVFNVFARVGWSRAFSPGMVDFPRAHKRSNLSCAFLLSTLIIRSPPWTPSPEILSGEGVQAGRPFRFPGVLRARPPGFNCLTPFYH